MAPTAPSEKPQTIQSTVLRRLRDGLMEGALAPGQVISIRKMAAVFGTSPMPVRDAIAQLVAANALQELPNKTVCVPILSLQRLEELFDVRAYLEVRAARAACARVTPDLIAELTALNEDVDLQSLQSPQSKLDILRRNRDFHFTLYRHAQSEVLMPLIESLWMQVGPTLYQTLDTPNAATARTQHHRIMEGLQKADAEMVADALGLEIRKTAETLKTNYEALLARGALDFLR